MRRTILLVVSVLGLIGHAPVRAGVTVTLKETAALAGDYVRLCEVAAVEGDEEHSLRVSGLFLGPTPETGETREITREQIRSRLREVGLDAAVQVAGANAVVVRRSGEEEAAPATEGAAAAAAQAVEPSAEDQAQQETVRRIGRAVQAYLAQVFQRDDLEVRVEVSQIDGQVMPAAGSFRVREIQSGRLPGSARIILETLDASGRPAGDLRAQVKAEATAAVLLVRRDLQRGEPVRPGDLLLQRALLKSGVGYIPLDVNAVAGRQAARFLRALSPIQAGDLEQPLAVCKGQKLTVLTKAGGFEIRMEVIALADGRVGELIAVENLDSKRQFTVYVSGFGTAILPSDRKG